MASENDNLYVVSSSPHAHSGASVQRIMLDVIIALVPAMLVSFYLFGWHSVRLVGTCVTSCVVFEALCRKAMKRDLAITDLSAVVTGILLAFNLPPTLPTWMAIAGSLIAIGIAKQVFGGIGYNPFNPALVGRAALLVGFTGPMTSWSTWTPHWADASTSATPLGMAKEAFKAGGEAPFAMDAGTTMDLFLGNMNGCIGEVSAAALLLGGIYLLYRRCISWHIPVAYIGTVVVLSGILWAVDPAHNMPPHFHVLAGGLILGGLFMATDMVTSPVTRKGMLVFGVGCGLLTMAIRRITTGAYPEGVSFAILLMNAATPLINRATRPRVFGQRRKK